MKNDKPDKRNHAWKLSRPTWADYLLGAFFLLLAAGCLLAGSQRIGDAGLWAEISSDGQSLGRYSLNETREILVEQGRYKNKVCLGHGQVYVEEANCPDQYCVKHAPISKEGEVIVCLPARLLLSIGGGEEAEWDAISK